MNLTNFNNWRSSDGWHAFHDTSIGRYTIAKPIKRRLVLRLNGRVIGVASDPILLRRLAETDYKQRTSQHGH